MTALIELKNVTRSFETAQDGTVHVLRGIDLSIEPGSFNVIRGESGSGKTTLLKVLGFLDSAFGGNYQFGAVGVEDQADWWLDEVRSANIGFIFQDGQLFDHLTLRQNIELPLSIQGSAAIGADAGERIARLAPMFFKPQELAPSDASEGGLLSSRPVRASGGQRQRAAVMRAIVHRPCLILADEPTASLDQLRKADVLKRLIHLTGEGHTVVVVTHDELFRNVGRQLEMVGGKLLDHGQVDPQAQARFLREIDDEASNLKVEGAETSDADGSPVIDAEPDFSHKVQTGDDPPQETSASEQLGDTERDAAPATRADATALSPKFPREGSAILWGWRPRASAGVLMRQAVRETFQRWLFLLLILSALIAGVTQVSVFSSVITGAETIVDKAFVEGSRLNRLELKPKLADVRKEDRFPISVDIQGWPNVQQVVRRRESVVRMENARGERISYISMGLHPNDPEYKLLDFLAGGPFSDGHDQLEVIITASLLGDFFDTSEIENQKASYEDFIGRQITTYVKRFAPGGEVLREESAKLTIAGIILNAEGGRQLYLPNNTQIIIDRVKGDKTSSIVLPVNETGDGWSISLEQQLEMIKGPWADKLQVYTTGVRDILPVIKKLTTSGYRSKSDIWDFKWALDVQDIAWRIFTPLLILIISAVTLTIMTNIYTSAKIREKEFALWRVLGMRRGDIALLQVLSAVLAITFGALIGLAVAWFVVEQSRAYLAEQYVEDGFDQIFAPVQQFFGMILVGALVVGALSAVAPAIRTARTDPAKVLQS